MVTQFMFCTGNVIKVIGKEETRQKRQRISRDGTASRDETDLDETDLDETISTDDTH